MEIPVKWVQIEWALDFYLITNRCLQEKNSTRARVREIPAKRVLIKYALDFHFIISDCVVYFVTLCLFLSILCCRESPKVLIGASIVFISLISKVILSRIDYSSIISF